MKTAEKLVANREWPQVVGVTLYKNPHASVADRQQLVEVQNIFGTHGCRNIANFVDHLQFEEVASQSAVSYMFTLVPHYVKVRENIPYSGDEWTHILLQPDLEVGSRGGILCAHEWLHDTAVRIDEFSTAQLFYVDQVFAQAISFVSQPGKILMDSDLIALAERRQLLSGYKIVSAH